ncbi:hypothetical protein [Paraburkholderia tropica]|uniref:hypothetical protein n=1 Tax=Paraburkholderia tropica TaxID=92647 RepID=UPI00161EDAE5|nr:hypothetical protein [Paraburkholderia tropica]MBB6320600.1 hypothetical protein [Paraburkholderia tropica]
MDRLIASNSVPMAQADTAPTTGTPQGATDGNPASNIPATRWPSYQYNAIQEELIAVLTAGGVTPDRTNNGQIAAAIKALRSKTSVIADTGAVNAYAAANATPLTASTWLDGVVQAVKIAHTNTGASTYAPDGLSAIPIYGLGLAALQQGELFAGGTAILMRTTIAGVNSGNPICLLMECGGGAQQVPPATASGHAPQFGQVNSGRLLNIQVLSSSGTYTPTAGTNSVIVEAIGGGGGSGGVAAPGTGSGGISKAGQSGAYAKVRFTTGFSGAAVTVGAAGSAGAAGANAGGTGGTTSFGSLISCPGGSGSPAGSTNSGYVFLPSVFGAAAATITGGTTLASLAPAVGSVNVAAASGGVGVAGSGANTPLGIGGIGATQGPGNAGNGYGVGAGGSYAGTGTAAQAGAAGTPGVVIIYEYA